MTKQNANAECSVTELSWMIFTLMQVNVRNLEKETLKRMKQMNEKKKDRRQQYTHQRHKDPQRCGRTR
jgi:hypothetical protein